MGSWNVLSTIGRFEPINSPFGHNFFVKIRIQYTPTRFSKFVEPPNLAWDEVIMVNNYRDGNRWEFQGNMYTHKPASPTVKVWGQRYFRAYLNAHGRPYGHKGYSKLFDRNNSPVPGRVLGTHNDMWSQNKAVQDYLKSNGGILEIEVHDIPGIVVNEGDDRNMERVLIFNCGVVGMGSRVKAWQHIKIDQSQPRESGTRDFQMTGNAPGIKTTGLELVFDYAQTPSPQHAVASADG